MERLILASLSPRRSELLKQVGIPFQVVESTYREPEVTDEQAVESIALAKARAVHPRYRDALIIGADTVVVCADRIFGKPESEHEARLMLEALSGNIHRVITAVALVRGSREVAAREETLVWMRRIEEDELSAYIATGEPMDKAGAYAVQGKGAVFVERIEGCFFNVVGLPLARLVSMLKSEGVPIWPEGGD